MEADQLVRTDGELNRSLQNTLTISPIMTNYRGSPMRLDFVKILAVTKPIASVTVNDKPYSNYIYNLFDQVRPDADGDRTFSTFTPTDFNHPWSGHEPLSRIESDHSMDDGELHVKLTRT